MAITKDKKQKILDRISEAAKNAESLVFVSFHGLSVEEEHAMRNTLREKGISYYVTKKTLAKRALQDAAFEGDMPELEGELALAWGDDPVAPAREVYSFAKGGEVLAIKGGVFEGVFKSAAEMNEIATIPGMHELRGMFVNVINSPIQGLAVALNELAKKKEASA